MDMLINTFCTLLITCAMLVVQSANPVYSVLYLILAFFNASSLVLLSGHDYMGAIFIILYVGAMCTFFLFAIMILDIKVEQVSERRLKQTPVNGIIAGIFALQCKNILNDYHSAIPEHTVRPLTANILDYTTQIYNFGAVLYTTYAWHLIIASLVLLSAMLGSIVLTSRVNQGSMELVKTQKIYEQNLRDFKLTVTKNR